MNERYVLLLLSILFVCCAFQTGNLDEGGCWFKLRCLGRQGVQVDGGKTASNLTEL